MPLFAWVGLIVSAISKKKSEGDARNPGARSGGTGPSAGGGSAPGKGVAQGVVGELLKAQFQEGKSISGNAIRDAFLRQLGVEGSLTRATGGDVDGSLFQQTNPGVMQDSSGAVTPVGSAVPEGGAGLFDAPAATSGADTIGNMDAGGSMSLFS